uniref:Uncharacterized protein n=1 Tax=Arundo donax TaxID=35708 RepID=A0A0A9GTS1_ARUDO
MIMLNDKGWYVDFNLFQLEFTVQAYASLYFRTVFFLHL